VQDPHWNELLQYAVVNGAYTGCPLEGVANLTTIATTWIRQTFHLHCSPNDTCLLDHFHIIYCLQNFEFS